MNSIKITSKEKYLSNFKEICSHPRINRNYPNLSYECSEALFDAFDKNVFLSIAHKFSKNPSKYGKGWPDLTIIKGKEVRFIEVKTTDSLTKSQLLTIPAFKKILPYKFSVCRVMK